MFSIEHLCRQDDRTQIAWSNEGGSASPDHRTDAGNARSNGGMVAPTFCPCRTVRAGHRHQDVIAVAVAAKACFCGGSVALSPRTEGTFAHSTTCAEGKSRSTRSQPRFSPVASPPTYTLPSGDALPVVGFGTWNPTDEDARAAPPVALDRGYIHVDTASATRMKRPSGTFWPSTTGRSSFSRRRSSPQICTTRVCSGYCPQPWSPSASMPWTCAWPTGPTRRFHRGKPVQALERAHANGMVRNVGVSNFTAYPPKFAQKIVDVSTAVNQIEYHPWYQRTELLRYCQEHDIVVPPPRPRRSARRSGRH